MSLKNPNQLDAAALSEDGELILLLADDALWDAEEPHLALLQEKLNYYLFFIESGQSRKIYPDAEIASARIEIHFSEQPTPFAEFYLEDVKKLLAEQNIALEWETEQFP